MRDAAAWRATLVSASWATRYAAVSTGRGSGRRVPCTRNSTGMPAARLRATRSSTSASVGVGRRGARSGSARRTSTSDRSSSSASLLAALIAPSALSASSGRSWIRCNAVPACTLMSDRLCATTSCNSRAIRSCSSRVRSRSSSAWARRVSTARSRRIRTISVVVASTSNHAASPRAAAHDGESPVPSSGGSHRNVIHPLAIVDPRDRPVPRQQRGAEGDDQGEVHGTLRVAEHDVGERGARRRRAGLPPGSARARRARPRRGRAGAPRRHRSRAGCPGGCPRTPHRRSRRLRPRRR